MHLPVLLEEVIEYLDPQPGDVILDATAGGGGHSGEIVKRIAPGGKLIAVDRDAEAVERIRGALGDLKNAVICLNEDFRNIDKILDLSGEERLDGALFDLGMSSFQVDEGARGFSFLREGPLDMRFDTRGGVSAEEAVNRFGAEKLTDIIREYGEERHAKLVARAICSARRKNKIETTGALVEIIKGAIGRKYSRQRLHPAARTFQALRIYVNDELGALEEGVKRAIDLLNPGARICVISFHSLEDRIVKNVFRDSAGAGTVKLLTRKPVCPGEEEVRSNPRSRSSKLRVAERIL